MYSNQHSAFSQSCRTHHHSHKSVWRCVSYFHKIFYFQRKDYREIVILTPVDVLNNRCSFSAFKKDSHRQVVSKNPTHHVENIVFSWRAVEKKVTFLMCWWWTKVVQWYTHLTIPLAIQSQPKNQNLSQSWEYMNIHKYYISDLGNHITLYNFI